MADGDNDLRGDRCNAFALQLWWLWQRFDSPERVSWHTNRKLLDHCCSNERCDCARASARDGSAHD